MRRLTHSVLVSVLILSVFFCSGSQKASSEISLRDLLPQESLLGGWNGEGDLQEFRGEDLYIYINGGAEIYLEYGFRSVVIQDFVDAAGHSVSLEIFEMTAPASAYGMFTFKISGEGHELDLGDGGELDSYYLNFWKGPYLVTLTGFDGEPETIEGLQSIARAVEALISVQAQKPFLASLISELGYERTRYLRGFLGLNSVYSFYTARGLNFDEGVRGIGDDGNVMMILNYGTEDRVQNAYEELREYLSNSDRFTDTEIRDNDILSTTDGHARRVSLSSSGRYLLVAIGPKREKALRLFELVRSKLVERPASRSY